MSPPPSTLGSVILLNGTSSAGKSTLANAIQDVMDAPYLSLGIDCFFEALPQRYRARLAPDVVPPPQAYEGVVWVCTESGEHGFRELLVGPVGQRLWSGMRHAAAALARRGNHVILDDVILDHEALVDYGAALDGVPTLLVGVTCPPTVLEAREVARGDRVRGLAAAWLPLVERHAPPYDVTVDTSFSSPEEGALAIKAAAEQKQWSRAFTQLKETLTVEPRDQTLPAKHFCNRFR
jgi:chloramphenicol 3-O phosphotransferase